MKELQDTYTFTARSVVNPDAIVTFTLTDHSLRVNLTGMVEKMEKVLVSEDKPSEVRHQVISQIQPAAVKFLQGSFEAIPLDDVNAKFDGDRLMVNTWKRVGGLRLAPLMISIQEVDNPDATEAFVNELNDRKSTARHLSRFVGPLDYWIGWVGLLFGLLFLLRWSSRQKEVSS
jgi:hypothetical protein